MGEENGKPKSDTDQENVDDEICNRAFDSLLKEHGYEKNDALIKALVDYAEENCTSVASYFEMLGQAFTILKIVLEHLRH